MRTRAYRFVVTGKVQGVCFRASARDEGQRLGLRGHAKNLRDGSVEVVAVGDADALEALAAWLERGPPMANVIAVQRDTMKADAASDARTREGFVIA